jgi:outer membrane protein assembly factor BamA
MQLSGERWLSAARLDSAIRRLDATELYDRVRYRFDTIGADTVLVLSAASRAPGRLGVGLRYDDNYKASILLSVQLRNRLGFGSVSQFDLRLGEQLHVGFQHFKPTVDSWLIVGGIASYSRTPVPIYQGGRRIAEATAEATSVSLALGGKAGSVGFAGFELRGEHSSASAAVSAIDTSTHQNFASGALIFRWNDLDRPDFPRRGAAVSARSEHALGDQEFVQHVVQAQGAVPVTRSFVLQGRAAVGSSTGGDAVPLHHRFMLGGNFPSSLFPETQVSFAGLRPQEEMGPAVVRVGAAVQWEQQRNVFVIARGDVGYAGDYLTMSGPAYRAGGGIGVGAITAFGPVELAVSSSAWHRYPRVEFSLGRAF